MIHLVLTAFLLLNVEPALTIRFIGNEAFEISDGRTTILTDYPYRSGAFGYMMYDAKSVKPAGNVVLLVSHRHLDHFDPTIPRQKSWRIIGPLELTRTITDIRAITLDSVIKIGDIRIHPIATPHSGTEHYSYRVEWAGLQLYFVGDTDDPQKLLRQSNLDYVFITPWLLHAVQSSGQRIQARNIVLYHHKKDERITDCQNCWIPKQGDVRKLK